MDPGDEVTLTIDGQPVTVPAGTSVAAAVGISGRSCRRSVSGEPRAALCGMGVCFECRVTVDGRRHVLGCQRLCTSGLEVRTGD